MNYTEENIPQAPYTLTVLNSELSVPENQDFTVELELSGDALPEKVYLVRGGQQFKLDKEDLSHFSYTFKNVQKDTPFQFYAGVSTAMVLRLAHYPLLLFSTSLSISSFLRIPVYKPNSSRTTEILLYQKARRPAGCLPLATPNSCNSIWAIVCRTQHLKEEGDLALSKHSKTTRVMR